MEAINPKHQKALALYKDPMSPTFGELRKSFIQAGFKPGTASRYIREKDNIPWLSQSLQEDIDMVRKAQHNLHKMLNIEIDLSDKNGVQIARLQHDVNKYVLDNLARGKYGRAIDTEDPEQGKVVVNIHQYGKPQEKVYVREAEGTEVQGA